MASLTDSVDMECPVCHEDFAEAKFLPCGHVACRKCILSWLSARGQGGCPLCRAPILPTPQPGQEEMLAAVVDKFPTDLVTMALVESKQALSGTHMCGVCDMNVAATSFCLDCSIKLCPSCTNAHKKMPFSRDHRLEDLDTLTPGRLAASRRSPCVSHPDRPGDMYCPAHLSLICVECFSSSHDACGVKSVAKVAKQERAALTDQAGRFRDKESAMDEQINRLKKEVAAAQAHFSNQCSEVKVSFDRLQQRVENRCHEILAQLQRDEDDIVSQKRAEIASLEEQKAALAAHAGSVERLVVPAPDGALLGMLVQLKARLDGLEKKSEVPKASKADGTQQCLVCGLNPATMKKVTGAELAKILKVGDRVKRGQDWSKQSSRGNQDGGGHGTVTRVPSHLGAGCVDVKWDAGGEHCYCMGVNGLYRLELV